MSQFNYERATCEKVQDSSEQITSNQKSVKQYET